MTKKEVLTRILEEGKRVFEKGGSFTVNGVLIANFYGTAELRFGYEDNTEKIRMIYMYCGENIVLCIVTSYIRKIVVNDDWFMRPGIGDTVFGRVNGERYSCK